MHQKLCIIMLHYGERMQSELLYSPPPIHLTDLAILADDEDWVTLFCPTNGNLHGKIHVEACINSCV